jgi:hypothetical protein
MRSIAAGAGAVEVHGDEIVFSHGSICVGIGHYRWAIDAKGVLTLAPMPADECPGRARGLVGIDYTR